MIWISVKIFYVLYRKICVLNCHLIFHLILALLNAPFISDALFTFSKVPIAYNTIHFAVVENSSFALRVECFLFVFNTKGNDEWKWKWNVIRHIWSIKISDECPQNKNWVLWCNCNAVGAATSWQEHTPCIYRFVKKTPQFHIILHKKKSSIRFKPC